MRRTRRQVLRAVGLAGAAGLAGCQGNDGEATEGSGEGWFGTETAAPPGTRTQGAETDRPTEPEPVTEAEPSTRTETDGDRQTMRVGVLSPVSGPFPALGRRQREAARLAVEQVNGATGVDIELEAVYGDSGFQPDRAARAAQRLIAEEDVEALVGGVGGGAAFGVADLASQAGVVYLSGAQPLELTGSECNDWTFRVETNTAQLAAAVAEYVRAQLGPRVYFLYSDFTYGQNVSEWTRRRLSGAGEFTEAGSRAVAVGRGDFGGTVEDIRRADPDAVVLGLVGQGFVAFLDQAREAGLAGETGLVAHRVFSGDRDRLGPSADGLLTGAAYDHSLRTGDNPAFVRAYERRFGRQPTNIDRVGYDSVRVLARAATAAGSASPGPVRRALEGGTFPTVLGSVTVRAADHQAVNPAWVGELSVGSDGATDLTTRTRVGGAEALPPEPTLGCER